ncbi:MAG: hypothetical protein GXX96_29935 [Planctomycetaceae bacterium]|nr:hypothetical protein [Planctomycetaceae bacterium]
MDFVVAGRQEIEAGILVRSAYVVISITDPGSRPARILKSAGFRDVLRLQFHDAIPVEGFTLPPEVVLMNKDHAKSIWQFVRQWQEKVDTFVVHCEQGMSRSPAVAAAICDMLGGHGRHFFNEFVPNRYVYDLLLTAAEDVSRRR